MCIELPVVEFVSLNIFIGLDSPNILPALTVMV